MYIFTVTLYKRNYGSALQAYALQSKLKELGAYPVIIQNTPQNSNTPISLSQRVCRFFRPEKHYGVILKIKRYFQRGKINIRNKKIDQFVAKYVTTDTLENCKKMSENERFLLLAGSDQVWSVLNHEIDNYYLLNNGLKGKKYSYAASTGISEFSEVQKKYYKEVLMDFEVLSLREEQAFNNITKIFTDKEIRCDLDPTLLYDASFWNRITTDRMVEEPYLFVYMLRPNNELITMARKVAKEKKLRIIYMGLYVNWYHGISTIVDAGVEEFLSYIRFADVVITNSFHGTVFSVLFEKNFASVHVESTGARAENLLSIVGLKDRLIKSISEINVVEKDIDYSQVNKRLNDRRESSISYLKHIIAENM